MSDWPLYKKDLLTIGNEDSSTGLCTLWTEKEKVLEHISPKNFHVAGQCYSKSEGISLIVRNVLGNKQISRIVLCGSDLDNTGDALMSLSEEGVDRNKKIIGPEDAQLESEIPLDAIERFRENVEIIDKRDLGKDYDSLDTLLNSLSTRKSWGSPETYERSPPVAPEYFPSEKTGFLVRGEKVGDVWLKALDTVLRFGHVKKSQYSDDQKEIVGLTSVITDEDPEDIDWKPYFRFTKKHFEDYLSQLMGSEVPEGVSYTYGSRLRNFRGKINQIDSMVDQLKDAIFSRRAVGVTWDVESDHDGEHSPCLNLVQALSQDKLHTTFYVRSNDMFGAWPENALGFRNIHSEISNRVGVEMGNSIIVSNSAHIYSSNWEDAEEIVGKHNVWNRREPDPRGNILIDLEDEKIKVNHLSPEGERIWEFYTDSVDKAYKQIKERQMVSSVGHALYIGGELRKAEYALRTGKKYVQDKPLD